MTTHHVSKKARPMAGFFSPLNEAEVQSVKDMCREPNFFLRRAWDWRKSAHMRADF